MSSQRGNFRFRIPWLSAGPAASRPPAPGGGNGQFVSTTSVAQPPEQSTGTQAPVSVPQPPPRVAQPPRTVFSPRLSPRPVILYDFTSPTATPPESRASSLPPSPTLGAPKQPVDVTPPQTPPPYRGSYLSPLPPRTVPERLSSVPSSPSQSRPQPQEADKVTSPELNPKPETIAKPDIKLVPEAELKGETKPLELEHPRTDSEPGVQPQSEPETKSATESQPEPRNTTIYTKPPPLPEGTLPVPTQFLIKPFPQFIGMRTESASLTNEPTSVPTTTLEPSAPSEKVVSETPKVEPEKSLKESDGGEKKTEKRKGSSKRDKTKAPKKEESKEKPKKATPHYISKGKQPIITQFVPPPPPPPPPPSTQLPSLQKGIKEDISKLINQLTSGRSTKNQFGEKSVDIVTLAGENSGALMRLSSELSRDASIHIHRGYKTAPDETIEATTEDGDQTDGKKCNDTEEEPEAETYVNSNIQEVNNSMVFESSMSNRNPGVHMAISLGAAEDQPVAENSNPVPESQRAEFSPTPSQKLTYQPVIKRRCLRGLFMESSDSDNDDPAKPRHHGCRYGCDQKSKDKDVNVQ